MRVILCRPENDIGAIFGEWREARRKQSSVVNATNWAGCAAPNDWIAQHKIDFAETDIAINRGKTNKGLGKNETANEHLLKMEPDQRRYVHETFGELFETGREPAGRQTRYSVPIDKPSTADPYECQQKRLLSLLSHFGKNYRQILGRRLQVILRPTLRDTQALKYNAHTTRYCSLRKWANDWKQTRRHSYAS